MNDMQERTTISVIDFCQHHQIEISFVRSLQEYGLLPAETSMDDDWQLPQEQLSRLESLVRLHYDLHINFEGLDAIDHLLQRLQGLQDEVAGLRCRLRLYENI